MEWPLAPATSDICKELWEMRGIESYTVCARAKSIEKKNPSVTYIQSSSENEDMETCLFCENLLRLIREECVLVQFNRGHNTSHCSIIPPGLSLSGL